MENIRRFREAQFSILRDIYEAKYKISTKKVIEIHWGSTSEDVYFSSACEIIGLLVPDHYHCAQFAVEMKNPSILSDKPAVYHGWNKSYQSFNEAVNYLSQTELFAKFVATEKADGSSLSAYLKDGKFGVCSRNLDLTEAQGCRFWSTVRKLEIEEILRTIYNETGKEICFQGELIGEGIQKNPYKLQGNTYKIFTVFNITEQIYISHEEVILLSKSGLFPQDLLVPILDNNITLTDDVEQLLKMAEIKSLLNPDVDAEGIVLRPYSEEGYHPKIGRLSFKVISNKYLLKGN
jgi:hypothetical protein